MKKSILRAGVLALWLLSLFPALVYGQAPSIEVLRDENAPANRTASFDFRFSGSAIPPTVTAVTVAIRDAASGAPQEPNAIPAATLSSDAKSAAAKVDYIPWKETGQTAAYLFLVETSDASGEDEVVREGGVFSAREVRRVNRNATVQAFSRLLVEAARNRQAPIFGLYTFSDTLDKQVPVGQSPIDFYNKTLGLASIDTDQKSRSAMLYRSARTAIEDLAAYKADRKALVILGSGRSSDSPTHTSARVAQLARENQIAIYTIGVSETPAEDTFLQLLQQLSDNTGGAYQRLLKVGGVVTTPPNTSASLFAGLESGGRVTVEFPQTQRGKTAYEVVLALSDGTTSRISRQIELPADSSASDLRVEEDASTLSEIGSPGDPLKLSESSDKAGRRYTVDFRLREPVETDRVEWDGTKPESGEAPQVDYTPWKAARQPAAYFFLIDVSSQAKEGEDDPALVIFRKTVSRLLDEDPGNRQFGLAAVGEDFSEIAPLGAFSVKKLSEELATGLAGGKKNNPCHLLSAATKAIERLAENRAERKVLVILGSGRAHDIDGPYSFSSVRKLAAEKQVTIQTVGFNPGNRSVLQNLHSLSEATQGTHTEIRYDAGERKALLPRGFFERFYRRIENGGRVTVTFPAVAQGRQEVKLKLLLSGGTTAALTGELPPIDAAPGPGSASASGSASSPASTFWKTYATPLSIAGAVVLMLVIFGVTFHLRTRHRRTAGRVIAPGEITGDMPPPPDITQLTQAVPDGAVFAWLEMLDASRERYAMDRPAFRLGRNPANDLVFGNDSVSGFHAELLRSRDGRFTLTDLDSTNGTLVNGRRVDSALLENNDVVELGEVKFRFLPNT